MVPRVLAAVLFSFALAACSTPVEEQAIAAGNWVPLFNGKDLTGWEVVGAGDWAVEDGQIVARRKTGEFRGGWLVTERDYGDFKLRLKFKSTRDDFNSGILIRDPGHAKVSRPAFNGFEIQIENPKDDSSPDTNGAIYALARAYPESIAAGEWSDFEVHCIGDHIVTFVNGKKMAEAHTRRSYKGAVGLQLHGGREPAEFWFRDVEIQEVKADPPGYQLLEEELEQAPGRYVDLLQGRTLEDFEIYWESGATWTLNDGVLRGEKPEHISWLFTRESYSDFVLSYEARISPGGNGGASFRFPWPADGNREKGPAFLGYEVQFHKSDVRNTSGSIYELARAHVVNPWGGPVHREEGWNQYRIYCKGDHIVSYMNLTKAAELHSDRSLSGRIGFQVHEPAEWVEYRNVRLKVLE